MGTVVQDQPAHERQVFLEFARAVNLSGDHTAAESRDPPEPDIFYPSAKEPCYFELGRLADANHAKYVREAFRRAPAQVTPDVMKIGYPQRDMLRRKLAKTYSAAGLPVHLLLYFDVEAPWVEGPIPPIPFETEAVHVMEPILRDSMGPFAKVWYFERYRRTLLWSYPS
jgi:hypothetical protein